MICGLEAETVSSAASRSPYAADATAADGLVGSIRDRSDQGVELRRGRPIAELVRASCVPPHVDDDRGVSGDGTPRSGFERLLRAVCDGQVGAVFSIEASRLARNGREWHTLLEFCGIVGVLLIDAETVYDPRLTNDRLLLGVEVRSRSAPCRSLEEEFYLPARFVDLGNDKCRKQEVIRQEFQSFVGFNIKIADTS